MKRAVYEFVNGLNVIEPNEVLSAALHYIFDPKEQINARGTLNKAGFVEIHLINIKIKRKFSKPNAYYVNGKSMSLSDFFDNMKENNILPFFEEFFFITDIWVSKIFYFYRSIIIFLIISFCLS